MQFVARLNGRNVSYDKDATFRIEQQLAPRRNYALYGCALTISDGLAKHGRAKTTGIKTRLVAVAGTTKKTLLVE